jgi:DNA-binding transcriptional regulator GbsR (MarR family)
MEGFMAGSIAEVRSSLIDTMGRISSFWGFSKIMGQLYGLLYLSEAPMPLDEMAAELKVSKGNVSVNIRALERWSMVRRVWVRGDRRDFYEAETDIWSIVKGVLREREQKEFAQALDTVAGLRQTAEQLGKGKKSAEAAFAAERLKKLEEFIKTMDRLVSTLLTLEDLKRNIFSPLMK